MTIVSITGGNDRRSMLKRFEKKSKAQAIAELVDMLHATWTREERTEKELAVLKTELASVKILGMMPKIMRNQVEQFLVDYHKEVFEAGESGMQGYDEAGRQLAKAFLAQFDDDFKPSPSIHLALEYKTESGMTRRMPMPVDRVETEDDGTVSVFIADHESDTHPDDLAVNHFARAMKAKLRAAREKGRSGWSDPDQCSAEYLAELLVDHLSKGNAGNFEDIANFAMMLHQRGDDPKCLADAIRNHRVVKNEDFLVERNKLGPLEGLLMMDMYWSNGKGFCDAKITADQWGRVLAIVNGAKCATCSDTGKVEAEGGGIFNCYTCGKKAE